MGLEMMGQEAIVMRRQRLTRTSQSDHPRRQHIAAKGLTPSADHQLLSLQRSIGNRAIGRFIQSKLKISQSGDLYEQEADRVADQVTRMPGSGPAISSNGAPTGVQRKCAACASGESSCPKCLAEEPMAQRQSMGAPLIQPQLNVSEEEEQSISMSSMSPSASMEDEDENSAIQRSADGEAYASSEITSRIESTKGQGEPLPESVQQDLGSKMGADFSGVRIHTGGDAIQLNRDLAAHAFTYGNDIYFNAGKYDPETAAGKHLLAHELTHVMQQGGDSSAGSVQRAVEKKSAPAIQRKLLIDNPSGSPAGAPSGAARVTNEKIVNDYIAVLCPDFKATSGKVEPVAGSCATGGGGSNPESCDCLCEMHNLGTDWTIKVDDNDWPHTDDATHTVTVHSPFSGLEFGQWTAGPSERRVSIPNWLVLGHEMCGHALLIEKGTHPTGPAPAHGGRESHDPTVKIQNKIAAEHGIPASELRGLFADVHHGESIAKVTIAEFPSKSADVSALPSSQARKLDIAEAFIKSAAVKVDIIGHADQPSGVATGNKTTSKKRAENVKKELENRSINSARFMVVDGVGDVECPSTGDQPSCRKVEIFMFVFEGGSQKHT
jgi:outer membrane protein OmpA-like peptidoglycan-associated protein